MDGGVYMKPIRQREREKGCTEGSRERNTSREKPRDAEGRKQNTGE